MTNRTELLEAALDSLPEGVALLGEDCCVSFWNQAAQAITGFAAPEIVGRSTPDQLRPLLECWDVLGSSESGASQSLESETGQAFLIHAHHKLGHEMATMVRIRVLRDPLGRRIGAAVLFHPAECLDALSHGVIGEDEDLESSLADLRDRLESLFDDFTHGGSVDHHRSGARIAEDPRHRRMQCDVQQGGARVGSGAKAVGTPGTVGRGRVSDYLS